MFGGGIFWFAMGVVFVIVALGARAWAKDLRLRMTWWAWILVLAWYALLNFTVALSFTLIGEGERSAGLRFLAFLGVITLLCGAILARWLGARRRAPEVRA